MTSRRTLAAGLVAIVVALAVLVEVRLPGALITVAALGLPLLLLVYWHADGVLRRLPRWAPALTLATAVALAIGWVLITGDTVVREAGSAFDAGAAGRRVVRDGLGVAEGGALLMLVPSVIVRLLWRTRRDPRDGFVIGVLGALVFTATATLTRLAPQFAGATVSNSQPVDWLFFEAAIRGIAVPLSAACAGGLVGMALWLHRSRALFGVTLCAALVLGIYALLGWADVEGVSQLQVLSWHIGMTVAALAALWLGRRGALGGIASDAASRNTATPSPVRVLVTWTAAVTALSAVLIGVPALTVKQQPRFNCPPDCGRPPSGTPVSEYPRFTAPGGEFSVAYPIAGGVYDVTTDATGVTARLLDGDGGRMRLTGEPARGRNAKAIAQDFLRSRFPTARFAYAIPNAKAGFQNGYGEVADVFPLDLNTRFTRQRVVVIAAVKNDFAVIAGGVGPFRQFGPDSGPGLPSPANVDIAIDMGRWVNSFMWRGDPPR